MVVKEDGIVFLGTTEEQHRIRSRHHDQRRATRFSSSPSDIASALESTEFIEQTACLRPLSSDWVPIMGPVPGLEGAYLATGHGRQGILQSPPSGKAMAELILDGATDTLDLAPFDPSRFAAS